MDKEIKDRIKSIVSVLLFLIVTTWYWYGPREDLAMTAANVNGLSIFKEVVVESEEEIVLNGNNYNFTVRNKTNGQVNYEVIINNDYSMQRINRCKVVPNNYLSYQLITDGLDNQIRNLGIDGIVYRGILNPKEIKHFSLNIKLDKDNISSDECFYPVVSTSAYNKI